MPPGIYPRTPFAESFWSKVDIRGPEECWPWKAAHDSKGYGRFRQKRASRVAWTLTKGSPPGELLVLHACDNPPCCNAAHFRLGTQADNIADKVAKGRQAAGDRNGARVHPERLARGDRNGARLHPERMPRGESHYNARLTLEQVGEIRRSYQRRTRGHSLPALAARFDVSINTVHRIVTGKGWI